MKRHTTLIAMLLLTVIAATAQVKTGIDVLCDNGFEPLQGKRVGLVTNPTGVNRDLVSTVDLLANAPGVTLAALYAPEHGVRGNVTAGAKVATYTDAQTGVKVWSIYGTTTKPTAAMLAGIDVMVYDIQDIGSRSYTFISTMGKCMEACAENGIPFIVLDRPNPLGGEKVEGCLVDSDCVSFVSQYPVPYVYGLTCGELARYLNGEGLLRRGVRCDLTVIPMQGWRRDMLWQDTGLEWVMTSPHVPQPVSALFYPASGILGELDYMNIGVGYNLPFQLFCASWADAAKLADTLNNMDIKGFRFRPIHIRPYYGLGSGRDLQGVQPYITDYDACELTLLQFHVMEAVARLWPAHKPFASATAARLAMFDKVCGSKAVRRQFVDGGYRVSAIRDLWMGGTQAFRDRSRPYLLY